MAKKKKIKSSGNRSNKGKINLWLKRRVERNVPFYDFIGDHDLETEWGIGECVENLISWIRNGDFLRWEAVVCNEQGLSLTQAHKDALDEIIAFSDGEDEPILYIDEIARPSEPWYEIVNKIVPKLILAPFETYKINYDIYSECWPEIVKCIKEHAQDLSLPKGITTPIDVIPPEIRHKLWLQYCFDVLSGLGQEEELTLANIDQKSWRIKTFIETLKECKESVGYFDLTIESLFNSLKLPKIDERILVESLFLELGIESPSEKLYGAL